MSGLSQRFKVYKAARRRPIRSAPGALSVVRSSKGGSAVELALLMPILILILFGIFGFGSAYSKYLAISHAAREGARLAAVGDYDEAVVRQRAYPANPDSITVSYPEGSARGRPVQVTIVDQYHLEIPFFGSRDIPLRATVVMRIET